MNIWNILTADRKINPIPLRHYFSRLRFEREDARVKDLPIAPLPVVQGACPKGGVGPVLFAVADLGYFNRFANIFVSSAALQSSLNAVHIHVLGVNSVPHAQIDHLPKHFTVTYEPANASQMSARYFQCMRFVRLAQFVRQSGRDYVAFDIDGLFQKSFANFSSEFSADIGLIVRPEFSDPGLRVNAGVVFMRASVAAQNFMDAASQHMLKHLQHAPYIEKLDQRCLALAIDEAVQPLPSEIYSFEHGQAAFYSAKGKAKNEHLQQEFERSMGEAS